MWHKWTKRIEMKQVLGTRLEIIIHMPNVAVVGGNNLASENSQPHQQPKKIEKKTQRRTRQNMFVKVNEKKNILIKKTEFLAWIFLVVLWHTPSWSAINFEQDKKAKEIDRNLRLRVCLLRLCIFVKRVMKIRLICASTGNTAKKWQQMVNSPTKITAKHCETVRKLTNILFSENRKVNYRKSEPIFSFSH